MKCDEEEPGIARKRLSTNAFEPVGVNIDKFIGLKQRFYLRPTTGEQGVEFFFRRFMPSASFLAGQVSKSADRATS
jgi:hypothetical protein